MFQRQSLNLIRQRVNSIRSGVVRLNSTKSNELKEVKVGENVAAPSAAEQQFSQVPQSSI